MQVDSLIQAVKYNVNLTTVLHRDEQKGLVISFLNLYNAFEQQIGAVAIDESGKVYWAFAWNRRLEKEFHENGVNAYRYDGIYWKEAEHAHLFKVIEDNLGHGFEQASQTEDLNEVIEKLAQGYTLNLFPEEAEDDFFTLELELDKTQMELLSKVAFHNNLTHVDSAQIIFETALSEIFEEEVSPEA
jgi:hypothetical protein